MPKTASPSPVNAGTNLTYTITITNNGPANVTGALVNDTFDTGKLGPIGSISWTCSITTGTGSCGIASGSGNLVNKAINLNNGAVATFTVTAQVLAAATGSVNNTASATVPSGSFDPNGANNSATVSTNINARVDLAVTKTASPSPVNASSNLTYTITVTNNGPTGVTGATVTDTFDTTKLGPIGSITWTCAVAPVAAGNACGAASGTGNINTTVNLNNGAVATYTVTAPVLAAATGSVSNTAAAAVPSGFFDPTAGNNSSTVSTNINAQVDLAVTKTASPSPVNAGQNLTYTITVTNGGPNNVTGALVNDTFDTTKLGPIGSISWTCAITGTGSCGAASGTGNLVNKAINLNSGAVATFTVTAPVLAAATGSVTNSASASVPAGFFDPTAGNNSASVTTPINAQADLSVTKTGPASVNAGAPISYTITVTNGGPNNVTAATVTDTFDVSKLSGITWTCAITTGTGTCGATSGSGNISTTVNLNSGAVATYTVSATVIGSATGSVSNTASAAVPSGFFDPTAANNTVRPSRRRSTRSPTWRSRRPTASRASTPAARRPTPSGSPTTVRAA